MKETENSPVKPPTSEHKVAANKANAQKSSGPKTAAGQSTSARNAVPFGLYSQAVVLETEDRKEYEALREQVWAGLAPRNVLEELLVREIVDSKWRLRRHSFAEATVFTRGSIPATGHDCGPGFAFVNDSQGLNTFSSLSRLPGKRRPLVLTLIQRDRIREQGVTIEVRPAWDWLLES